MEQLTGRAGDPFVQVLEDAAEVNGCSLCDVIRWYRAHIQQGIISFEDWQEKMKLRMPYWQDGAEPTSESV
jgi:hypothetical protein